jgi:hypothetical protein
LAQLKNLATPFIVMGDFNGHNPLWGSKTTTDKGKKLEDFLSQIKPWYTRLFWICRGLWYSLISFDITVSLNFKIGSVAFRIVSV